jgi:hypothetical protein
MLIAVKKLEHLRVAQVISAGKFRFVKDYAAMLWATDMNIKPGNFGICDNLGDLDALLWLSLLPSIRSQPSR